MFRNVKTRVCFALLIFVYCARYDSIWTDNDKLPLGLQRSWSVLAVFYTEHIRFLRGKYNAVQHTCAGILWGHS